MKSKVGYLQKPIAADEIQTSVDEIQPSVDELQLVVGEIQPSVDEIQPSVDEILPSVDEIQLWKGLLTNFYDQHNLLAGPPTFDL